MAYLGRKGASAALTSADIPDGSISAAKVAADVATQAELDAIPVFDDDKIQTNLAILAFKTATTGSLAKYNLQDQIIDEFVDATGVNAGDSTNEALISGTYRGQTGGAPTHDADATGTNGADTWYKWTDTAATGSYTPADTVNHEYLVVAGGGGGGEGYYGGGGGAGGYLAATGVSYASGSAFTITVGVGGTGSSSQTGNGSNGGVSSIVSAGSETTVSSVGGGQGASRNQAGGSIAQAGGSGGGAAIPGYNGGAGTAGPPRQGYDGGDCTSYGASGGGAGFEGNPGTGNPYGSVGAHGLENDIIATGTNVFYAGGGGGGGESAKAGGSGGGGAGGNSTAGTNGTDGFGGGGGGGGVSGDDGGDGGNGIVIIRRATPTSAVIVDLTLQSTDTTAEAAPTKADMVMLIEDAGSGVGTVNTHIKGWVSMYETGGTKTWTQGTLVDEGDWGTDKRILAFHDLTLTGTSGTQMAYKITTHSASAVYDTKIHATSIGWR